MPKCENCYHQEACEYFFDFKFTVENCNTYKDKSLVVELPCKVGDTLYVIIDESGGAYIKQEKAVEISTEGRIWTDDCYYDSDDVGRMIFFTREEVEKALEDLENERR